MADEMRHAVQCVIGVSGRYKSAEQQDAMQFVLQTHDASIVVLRTSGGKSLLFVGTAMLQPDRITIVIVPSLALLDDLVMRANVQGIHAQQWSSGTTSFASLIVVSADVAITGQFQHYATAVSVIFSWTNATSPSWKPLAAAKYSSAFYLSDRYLPPILEALSRESMLLNGVPIFRRTTERVSIGDGVVDCRLGVSWVNPRDEDDASYRDEPYDEPHDKDHGNSCAAPTHEATEAIEELVAAYRPPPPKPRDIRHVSFADLQARVGSVRCGLYHFAYWIQQGHAYSTTTPNMSGKIDMLETKPPRVCMRKGFQSVRQH
ncbi:MAG: hypothetical protein M1826_006194 [Phylliscum demangeonii]|nr:MAG: hypothetical protein M1826_006194 [Phylliscum demangeonii]